MLKKNDTFDWGMPQQNIYNLTHLTGFKNRKERRAMRQRLNNNPSAIIYNGTDFNRAGDLGHTWSRKDMRRVAREAQNNWEANYGNTQMYNSDVSTAKLGAYNLAGKARIMQWKPVMYGTRVGVRPGYLSNYQLNPNDFADTQTTIKQDQAVGSQPDNLTDWQQNLNDFEGLQYTEEALPLTTYEPVDHGYRLGRNLRILQQGGRLQSQAQSDPTEDMLRNAIFGYLGAKDDITSDKAIQIVLSAFAQNNYSIKEIAFNEDLIDKGKKKMQAEDQQNNTKLFKQIMQPGALIQLVNQLVKNNQQTQVAKMGTKLDYIKGLKPFYCPEGQEIAFMKLGSKVCPVCKKAHAKNTPHKAEDGEKIEKECGGGVSKMMKGIKAAMKCGGKMKKKMAEGGETKIEPTDTIHVGKKIYGLVPGTGYKQLTNEDYKKLPNDDKARVDRKDQMRVPKKQVKKGQEGLVTELPELTVDAKAPKYYYATERTLPIGNKRYVTSQAFYKAYPSDYGWRTYDFESPVAGRVIYTNPSRTNNPFDLQRDTVYFTNSDNNRYLDYGGGYMMIGEDKDQNAAKRAFNRASKVKRVDYSDYKGK